MNMRFKIGILMMIVGLVMLAACGQTKDEADTETNAEDDLKTLDVAFDVPETADVDEEVELKATVTYGDEKVDDADDVEFEYWEVGHEDDSTKVNGKNNKDGTYTLTVSFDHDGEYEMYAHVTARDLHTMPKKAITVGEGASEKEDDDHEAGDHHEHKHTDGFEMDFKEPENVIIDKEIELNTKLQMDEKNFEGADVRYEIWNDDISDKHDWIDAEEVNPGEYTANHKFQEAGTYNMIIHVTDDDGLHEHEEHEIEAQ